MTHSMTRLRHTIAALLLAATATAAGGCNTLSRLTPWGGSSSTKAPDATRTRDALRQEREQAWAKVREGKSPGGYNAHKALKLSEAEHELDAQTPWNNRPAPGRATFADLPRQYWWYLFVDPQHWAHGPLATDRAHLPGFYAAMMNAFDRTLVAPPSPAPAPQPITADDYAAMHTLVTLGVFREGKAEAQGFVAEPSSFAVAALHDPDVTHREHLASALNELRSEGVAAWNADVQKEHSKDPVAPWLVPVLDAVADLNPHSKPVHLIYQQGHDPKGEGEFAQWLMAWNDYAPGEARNWTAQWLSQYHSEQQAAGHALTGAAYLDAIAGTGEPSEQVLATLRPTCRLIRRLQVSRAFALAGDRLDTRLLLNRLLIANGLPPAVVRDPSLWAGRAPLDVLARDVVHGQRRFQELVTELSSRDTAPAPAPAPTGTAPPPTLTAEAPAAAK